MRRLIILIVSAITVLLRAQAPDALDLTQPISGDGRFTTDPVTVSGGGIYSGAKRVQLPLHVTLDWLDRGAYSDGESFVFHVTLENLGRNSVTLPWERDSRLVLTSADAPLFQALLTVDINAMNKRLSVPIATLYGSAQSPQNTKVLQPSARAEIVARGHWEFAGYSASDLTQMGLPSDVTVTARLQFLSGINGHVYSPLSSSNHVPIVLTRNHGH